MDCLFLNFPRDDFLFPRGIWRENPENNRRAQAKGFVRSGERLQRSETVRNYIPDKESGREAEPFTASIDPSPENQRHILEALRAKFDKHMPLRYASRFSGDVAAQYENILKNLPEAYLLQAITENSTEKELLDRFEDALEDYQDICERTSIPSEIWNALKDLVAWVKNPRAEEWKLRSENPGVMRLNTIVKPYHKTFLSNDLAALENYYRERLEETHGHWYGDEFNSDRRDFLVDHELPFMRELFLNRAILQNKSVKDLANHYSEYLKTSFRNCIEDPQTQIEQAVADRDEVNTRPGDARWLNILLQMRTHISVIP